MARRFAALLACLLARAAAADTPAPVGPEFQVNTYTTNAQRLPSVGMDASGGFVVVWQSWYQDGADRGVFARRFDESGTPQGDEFQVNTTTEGRQDLPAVATNADGAFVVVWRGYTQPTGYEVFARRYDSSGEPLGDELQLTDDFNGESPPAVATRQDSGFVVVWETEYQSGSAYDVFARRYDSAGAPMADGFQVNVTTEYDQTYPAVSMDAAGGFVVVWQTYDAGPAVLGRRFASTGLASSGEFVVADAQEPRYPAVTNDPDGGFFVAWQGYSDGSGSGVFARGFDSGGSPLGDASPVNAFVFRDQREPAVAARGAGDFVVAWQSLGQDGDYYGVFGRALGADGQPIGDEFQVNTETVDYQGGPAIAGNGQGEFVVVWSSYGQDGSEDGVFAQRFAPEPASWTSAALALAVLVLLARTRRSA